MLFAAVQVAQRSLNYGVLGPAKEMLFTVVDRETKYKSKNFIDTAVYRGSDVTASWIFKGLTPRWAFRRADGLGLSARDGLVGSGRLAPGRNVRPACASRCRQTAVIV